MKRTLILIANAGTPDNLAAGANKDIRDYRNFFKSDCGGAWYDSEVFSFNEKNPLSKRILYEIIFDQRKSGSEYFLIVFCGHGGATKSGDTIFELSPGNECMLNDLTDMLRGVRFMLIADSCRSIEVLQEGGVVQKRGIFSHIEDSCEYRKLCRDYYDKIIQSSSAGAYTICFSADFKETAMDQGRIKGGLFSQKFLDCIFQDLPIIESYVVSRRKRCLYRRLSFYVDQVFPIVVKASGDKQHPQIICKDNKDELPLVVCPNWQLQDLGE